MVVIFAGGTWNPHLLLHSHVIHMHICHHWAITKSYVMMVDASYHDFAYMYPMKSETDFWFNMLKLTFLWWDAEWLVIADADAIIFLFFHISGLISLDGKLYFNYTRNALFKRPPHHFPWQNNEYNMEIFCFFRWHNAMELESSIQ